MSQTRVRTSDDLRSLSTRAFNSAYRIEIALVIAELDQASTSSTTSGRESARLQKLARLSRRLQARFERNWHEFARTLARSSECRAYVGRYSSVRFENQAHSGIFAVSYKPELERSWSASNGQLLPNSRLIAPKLRRSRLQLRDRGQVYHSARECGFPALRQGATGRSCHAGGRGFESRRSRS